MSMEQPQPVPVRDTMPLGLASDLQARVAAESPTKTIRFGRAFVGCFGPPHLVSLGTQRSGLPPGGGAVETIGAGGLAVRVIGDARPTIVAQVPAQGVVVVKGRPFALSTRAIAQLIEPARGPEEIDDGLAQLDGKFALCSGTAERLILATDLIGAGPLYYSICHQVLYFSSHLGLLIDILPAVPAPLRMGVASLLLARGQLLAETQFTGVYRLRAGERLLASQDGDALRWQVGRYADAADVILRDHPSGRDVLGELSALFADAVRRQPVSERTALMLSGGRDSKALAYLTAGRHDAVTFGRPYSTDLIRARSLAARLGLRHRMVPYDRWTFETYAGHIVGLSGGASGLQVAHMMVAADWAASSYDAVIMGFLGGSVTGEVLGDEPQQTRSHVHRWILPNLHATDVDLSVCFADEVAALIEVVDRRIQELGRIRSDQAMMIMNMTQRQGFYIGTSFDLLEWFVDVIHPFYHRGLMRFWLNRPFEELRRQRLYDRWLTIVAPAACSRSRAALAEVAPGVQRLVRGAIRRIVPRAAAFEQAVSYFEVTRRSRDWLEQVVGTAGNDLARISRRSLDHVLQRGMESGIPMFCQSLPIMLAASRWQRDARSQ